jgi:hypothetical protein
MEIALGRAAPRTRTRVPHISLFDMWGIRCECAIRLTHIQTISLRWDTTRGPILSVATTNALRLSTHSQTRYIPASVTERERNASDLSTLLSLPLVAFTIELDNELWSIDGCNISASARYNSFANLWNALSMTRNTNLHLSTSASNLIRTTGVLPLPNCECCHTSR